MPAKRAKRIRGRIQPKTQIIREEMELDQAMVLYPWMKIVNASYSEKTQRWVLWIEVPATGEALEVTAI